MTVKIKQEILKQQTMTKGIAGYLTLQWINLNQEQRLVPDFTVPSLWVLLHWVKSGDWRWSDWKSKGIKVGQVPVNMEEPWRPPPALLTRPTCDGAVFQFLLVLVVKISPRRLQDKWLTSHGTCFTPLCPPYHANKSTLCVCVLVCVRCRRGLGSARFGQRLNDVYSRSEGRRNTWVSPAWFIKNKTGCERRSLRIISAGGAIAIAIALGRKDWLGRWTSPGPMQNAVGESQAHHHKHLASVYRNPSFHYLPTPTFCINFFPRSLH